MRTKFLLKAKKFFFETFGDGKFPEKDVMYEKMMASSFIPDNGKIMFSIFFTKEKIEDFHSNQLKPFDLCNPQMEMMKILYFSKDSSLNQEEIGRYMFASKASISTHLSKLEDKQLISRKENPQNKRQKLVSLTKQGEELLYSITDSCNPHDMPNLLSKEEAKEFIRLMEKVQNNIKNMEVKKT